LTAIRLRAVTIRTVPVGTVTSCPLLLGEGSRFGNHLSVARHLRIASPSVVTVSIGKLEAKLITQTILLRSSCVALLPFVGAPKIRPRIIAPVSLALREAVRVTLLITHAVRRRRLL
jgi:hypothetical protein